jgi:hypothetical protein
MISQLDTALACPCAVIVPDPFSLEAFFVITARKRGMKSILY